MLCITNHKLYWNVSPCIPRKRFSMWPGAATVLHLDALGTTMDCGSKNRKKIFRGARANHIILLCYLPHNNVPQPTLRAALIKGWQITWTVGVASQLQITKPLGVKKSLSTMETQYLLRQWMQTAGGSAPTRRRPTAASYLARMSRSTVQQR